MLRAKPPSVRYFSLFLAIFRCQPNIPGTLAFDNKQTARAENNGVVAAAMTSSAALGGIACSTILRTQDARLYLPGTWLTIAILCLYIVITLGLSMHSKRQNWLGDEAQAEGSKFVLEKTPRQGALEHIAIAYTSDDELRS